MFNRELLFYNEPATTEVYTLSLHDALPISGVPERRGRFRLLPRPARRHDLARWRPYLGDRKSTRLNSSHVSISYAVFCLKKKIDSKTSVGQPGERRSPAAAARDDGPALASG